MKFVYLTSKIYPGGTADHNFIRQMALSLSRILGRNFLLVVAGVEGNSLKGINFLNLDIKRKRVLRYLCWLPGFIRKNRGEQLVFFTNDVYLLLILIGWRAVWFRGGYRIVSDWHQLWKDWRDRIVARGSDLLITTSDRLKVNLMRKTGVSGNKVMVARGGVDLGKFKFEKSKDEIRKGLGLSGKEKMVGYGGGFRTMKMEKGVATLIESIRGLKIKLVLVGGKGREIEEYKEIADRLGVGDSCIFVPRQTEDKLAEYEMAVDGLVIPYPDEEHFREWGFPMKTYEYMASGTPIIYSDLEILREVLWDCATSFKPGEPENLRKAIGLVLQGGEEIRKKAVRAKEKVEDFTWDKRAEKILEFINKNDGE